MQKNNNIVIKIDSFVAPSFKSPLTDHIPFFFFPSKKKNNAEAQMANTLDSLP